MPDSRIDPVLVEKAAKAIERTRWRWFDDESTLSLDDALAEAAVRVVFDELGLKEEHEPKWAPMGHENEPRPARVRLVTGWRREDTERPDADVPLFPTPALDISHRAGRKDFERRIEDQDAAVKALDRTVTERAQKAVDRLNAAREEPTGQSNRVAARAWRLIRRIAVELEQQGDADGD